MRIFLTGATGFIGGHLLRALSERGHAVTCLARGERARQLAGMALPGVRVVEGEFTRPERWLHELPGHDAVINTVGIIRETRGSDFSTVHTAAPAALFEAAARAGVRKIVQVSALGADEGARSRYHLTKRAADTRLAELGVPYLVLRPSIVYGPGARSLAIFLALAALPVTPVPGDGRDRLQPVYVEDVVRALTLAVEQDGMPSRNIDVGGREALPLDAVFDTLARWLGKRHGARKLHVPWSVMSAVAVLTDATGGRGPITGEELAMLRRGNVADNRTFVETFGFEPVSFQAGIARERRDEATVWQARLTHLRVPLRLSVQEVHTMKVFLTGATGYIGSAVAEALQRAGHEVVGLARSDQAARTLEARGIRVARGDLMDGESLARAAGAADGVIHLGSTQDANLVQADQAAVEAILGALAGTDKPFVYTSGVWVIGPTGDQIADEETPTHPAPIAAPRLTTEQRVLAAAAQGTRTVVIRPAMVYGRGGGSVSEFFRSAREDGTVRFIGTGENRWAFVHVEDLADLYVRALEKAPAGTLLNAASGPAVRVREIAEAASRAAGAGGRTQAWPLEEARQRLGPFADALTMDQQISGDRARHLLGWQPRAPSVLEELLQER